MRRDFLKLCGLAGLGFSATVRTLFPAKPSNKEPDPYGGPYYIVFNASGGWDTTYLMDPKGVDGINRLYKEGDIQTEGAHHFAPIAKQMADKEQGMSNEDFFKTYGKELLVYNGLDYSVNNHSPCSRYMATGKLDSHAYPTFAGTGRGLCRPVLSPRLPDLWELLRHRQPCPHVARPLLAHVKTPRQGRPHLRRICDLQ